MKNLYETFERKYEIKEVDDRRALKVRPIRPVKENYAKRKINHSKLRESYNKRHLNEQIKDVDTLYDLVDEAEAAIQDAIFAVKQLAKGIGGRAQLNLEHYMIPQLETFIDGYMGGGDTLSDIHNEIEAMQDEDDDEDLELDENCRKRINKKELDEAKKDLTQVPGTIAYCLNQHLGDINFGASALELKKACIDFVTNDSSIPEATVKDFVQRLNGARNQSALISTIGTYMTGMKV